MLLPALVLLVAFTHWPAASTLIDSFFSTPRGARPGVWVGLENYQSMTADPVFWKAVRNNLWFAGATIPCSIGLALVMALWVNERIPGRAFLRMAYFTPTVLPMIAVANIWLFFYTPQYGLLEQITGAFGLPSHNWLGSPSTALSAVTVVAIWKESGFFMIFYLAALQTLNPSLREAAATALCRACPVRRECAQHALTMQEPYGVWGGLTETDRSEQLFGPRPVRKR